MKKLEDIVLKKGDIVLFDDNRGNFMVDYYNGRSLSYNSSTSHIVEIKRPVQYKTIYQKQQEILDKEEKEYLSAVIRPFRDKIGSIRKWADKDNKEQIMISICSPDTYETIVLPYFEVNTMYKGMKQGKLYTLEELGL